MANQGVVEKYIGDSVMALFGAPLARKLRTRLRKMLANASAARWKMSKEMETAERGMETTRFAGLHDARGHSHWTVGGRQPWQR